MGFTCGIFQEFCTSRNVVLRTVIPGHRQSLGATARRHGHFRTIIDHIIGIRQANFLAQKEWGGSPSMPMIHLNAQVRQFGGFAPGRRVLGRTPKIPIGELESPHFVDFMNPKEAQAAKTHHLLGIIHLIRQESPTADFNGKLNLRLNIRCADR